MATQLQPIEKLKVLLDNPKSKLYRQEKDLTFTEIDKGSTLFLSWYGPTVYKILVNDETYYYMLTDQNHIYSVYNVGTPTKEKEFPQSFPALIKEL